MVGTLARFALAAMACMSTTAAAQLVLPGTSESLAINQGLVISGVSATARRTINIDVIAGMMAMGGIASPAPGGTIALPATLGGGTATWQTVAAGEDGRIAPPRGGYLLCSVRSEIGRAMILEARGHGMVYVNGEPRAGDPYGTGYVRLPVALRPGENQLLFAAGRGAFGASLVQPGAEILVHSGDLTAPDVLIGDEAEWLLGVPLLNCGDVPRRLEIAARVKGAAWGEASALTLAPLTVFKAPVTLRARASTRGEQVTVEIAVRDRQRAGETVASAAVTLAAVQPWNFHRRTFRSDVDGSVQEYAVTPPPEAEQGKPAQGLVLALHGAGVHAAGHGRCYSPKPELVIVSPTNRRPVGFDWEDWGRLDALEALHHAEALYKPDPRRIYVTGHSMGGHGAWQLGALFPHVFAAVAPSAGWLSFATYTGAPTAIGADADDALVSLIGRAAASSDTLALLPNLVDTPVYILHGDNDDNVPVREARRARDELARLRAGRADPGGGYHEESGAGHWWGNACVDWPGIFETFAGARRAEPGAAHRVRFVAMQAGVSGAAGGDIIIQQQQRAGLLSSVDLVVRPADRAIEGATLNVARLSIAAGVLDGRGPAVIHLDGGEVRTPIPPAEGLLLERAEGGWRVVHGRRGTPKSARHAGPLRDAFKDAFVLVYGTAGDDAENAWALAKARFDGEQWWYRGNGAARVMADTAYLDEAPDGNVILYGNAGTNRAWSGVLRESPVRVRRGAVEVGDRVVEGDDVTCLFVQPWRRRDGDRMRLAAAIGGSGLAGMRAADRLPVFLSGTGFPDLLVLRAGVWREGYSGVVAAGFFDNQWGLRDAEIAWRSPRVTPGASP